MVGSRITPPHFVTLSRLICCSSYNSLSFFVKKYLDTKISFNYTDRSQLIIKYPINTITCSFSHKYALLY